MTPEQIQAIRERAEKATEGPWEWDRAESYIGRGYVPQGSYLGNTLITLGDTYEKSWEDCEFIAHSREDVPALCDALEQVQAKMNFPKANAKDEKLGWTLDYNFLRQIETHMNPYVYAPSIEGIELVLLALEEYQRRCI